MLTPVISYSYPWIWSSGIGSPDWSTVSVVSVAVKVTGVTVTFSHSPKLPITAVLFLMTGLTSYFKPAIKLSHSIVYPLVCLTQENPVLRVCQVELQEVPDTGVSRAIASLSVSSTERTVAFDLSSVSFTDGEQAPLWFMEYEYASVIWVVELVVDIKLSSLQHPEILASSDSQGSGDLDCPCHCPLEQGLPFDVTTEQSDKL